VERRPSGIRAATRRALRRGRSGISRLLLRRKYLPPVQPFVLALGVEFRQSRRIMEKNPLIQVGHALLNPAHIVWARHHAAGELWIKRTDDKDITKYKGDEAEALWRLLTTDCQIAVPEPGFVQE